MEIRNSYYLEPVISHSGQQFYGSNLFSVDSMSTSDLTNSLTKQIAEIQISKSESFMDMNEEIYQEPELYETKTDFTKPLLSKFNFIFEKKNLFRIKFILYILVITDFQSEYMAEYTRVLAESAKGVYEFEPDLNSTDVGMRRIQSDYSIGGEVNNFYEPLVVPLFYEQLNKASRKQFLNFVSFQKDLY
jgi:hypothetical protein